MLTKRIILAPISKCKSLNKNIITKDELSIVIEDFGNSDVVISECTNDKIYFDYWQGRFIKKSRIKVAEIEYDDERSSEFDFIHDAKVLRLRDFSDNDLNNLIPTKHQGRFLNKLSSF